MQVTEYERMTRDVNRSAYTQRILEIVGNIRKQNEDIDKVKSVCSLCLYSVRGKHLHSESVTLFMYLACEFQVLSHLLVVLPSDCC